MRVLITGAAGQVGRALLATAPAGIVAEALTHEQLDITDRNAVATRVARSAPELIINAAGYTAVDRAESEQELAFRVNAQGPQNLASAARESGSRMIHISTDFVFDGTGGTPYRPDSPPRPLSVYGASKRAGEEATLSSLGACGVVLRTAWVYSAQAPNFLLTMLRLMANGVVSVVADQVGTPTSARSLAGALWGIAVRNDLQGCHHWTDAGVASWYDFAVAIAEESASLGLLGTGIVVRPISTADYPTPARRPSFSVLDKGTLYATLGLAPVHWRVNLRGVIREIRDA